MKIAKRVAYKVVNKNIETKHLYTQQDQFDVSNATVPYQLTTMTTGTYDNDILGSKCRLTSLWIRYTCYLSSTDSTNFIRVVVFQDKQQNLTTPSFQAQMFINSLTSPINAMYNVDSVPSRYAILYDKVVNIDEDDPTYYGSIRIRNFPKRTLEFEGTPTVLNAVASGHVYVLFLSDSALPTHPKVAFDSALFYKDA